MPRAVPLHRVVLVALIVGLAACDSSGTNGNTVGLPVREDVCSISTNLFADGGPGKDGIPALTDPGLVPPGAIDYMDDDDRVIGMIVDGRAIAVPHNILWWHEIANFTFGEQRIAVTYCPLTGSSMAFDRSVAGGAEFGVSGLLYQNNLTMYDRRSEESLWPQMLRRSGCGPADGQPLPMVAVMEMQWGAWKAMHPDTEAVDGNTGVYPVLRYTSYPYARFDYEDLNNDVLLFDMPIDDRRPPKERVLGLPADDGGVAYPFLELDDTEASKRAVNTSYETEPIVIFWDREAQGAMAFSAVVDGAELTFEVADGELRDTNTSSVWRLDGLATAGPLAGTRLEPIDEAYVAFWFAWAAFQPRTRIWNGS